jgi:hypothetical protein
MPAKHENFAAPPQCRHDLSAEYPHVGKEPVVTSADYTRKLDEIDRLLNDPDVAMEPARIWSLLA